MSRRRRIRAWLADWRNGATIAATLVAIAVCLIVVDAVRSRHDALSALRATASQAIDTRRAATRRIDLLTDRIGELESSTRDASGEIARLRAEVAALQEQLRGLGVAPVVVIPSSTTTTATARRPGPRRNSTTTTRPTTTTTTTTRPCLLRLPVPCVTASATARRTRP